MDFTGDWDLPIFKKHSNYVLAVWNGKSGSAGKLLSIARTLGKIVILIDSSTYEVRQI